MMNRLLKVPKEGRRELHVQFCSKLTSSALFWNTLLSTHKMTKMILLYQEDAVHSLWIFSTLFLGHRLCEEPAPIENGYRIGNKFLKGRNITYKCNKGYHLRGPQVRICKENGEWTEEQPTCEGEIVLPVLSYKKLILSSFLF